MQEYLTIALVGDGAGGHDERAAENGQERADHVRQCKASGVLLCSRDPQGT